MAISSLLDINKRSYNYVGNYMTGGYFQKRQYCRMITRIQYIIIGENTCSPSGFYTKKTTITFHFLISSNSGKCTSFNINLTVLFMWLWLLKTCFNFIEISWMFYLSACLIHNSSIIYLINESIVFLLARVQSPRQANMTFLPRAF